MANFCLLGSNFMYTCSYTYIGIPLYWHLQKGKNGRETANALTVRTKNSNKTWGRGGEEKMASIERGERLQEFFFKELSSPPKSDQQNSFSFPEMGYFILANFFRHERRKMVSWPGFFMFSFPGMSSGPCWVCVWRISSWTSPGFKIKKTF